MDAYVLLQSLKEKILEKYGESETISRSIAGVQAEIEDQRANHVPNSALLGVESEYSAAKYELELLKERRAELESGVAREEQRAQEVEAELRKKEQDLDEFAVLVDNELRYLDANVTALLEQDQYKEALSMAHEEERMERYLYLSDSDESGASEDVAFRRDIERLKSEAQKSNRQYDAMQRELYAKASQRRPVPIVSPKSTVSGRIATGPGPARGAGMKQEVSDKFKTVSELLYAESHPMCHCFPPIPAVSEKRVHSSSSGSEMRDFWVCTNLKYKGMKGMPQQCGFLRAKE